MDSQYLEIYVWDYSDLDCDHFVMSIVAFLGDAYTQVMTEILTLFVKV